MDDEIDIMGNSDESRDTHELQTKASSVDIESVLNLSERNLWSLEEKQLFEIGYSQFGNKWSKVAQLIGTKNPSQVRNYSQKISKEGQHCVRDEDYCGSFNSNSEITLIKKNEDDLDEIDIGFDNEGPSYSAKPNENLSTSSQQSQNSQEEPQVTVSISRLNPLELPISEEEKLVHSEFFSASGKKTPGRYLRIRSHILRAWDKCKPNYLTKGAARSGLNNCGDINSIGKIHAYLEKIGAINVNCETKSRKTGEKKVKNNNSEVFISSCQTMSLRKRKTVSYEKYDDDDMMDKGLTIEHGEDGSEINRLFVEKRAKSSKPKNNPFQLVPCHRYNNSKNAPFELITDMRALFVAETHSYLFDCEVIGLLGGHWSPEDDFLEIECAVPCNSLSSGVECEMDPVSQSEASEFIRAEGFKVVGWYHSHPTFEPNPSLRDLETQYKYQEMFQSQSQQPFISLIISPFLKGAPASKLCWWFIENDGDKKDIANNLEPYELSFRLTSKYDLLDSVVEKVEKVADIDKGSRQRIKKVNTEKLINTLRLHSVKAGVEEDTLNSTVNEIRKILAST